MVSIIQSRYFLVAFLNKQMGPPSPPLSMLTVLGENAVVFTQFENAGPVQTRFEFTTAIIQEKLKDVRALGWARSR